MRYVLLLVLATGICRAQEDDAAKQELMKDKKNVAVVFGTALCIDKKIRADALTEIVKEKKYAKVGGMVDKQKLYALQQRVRWADEQEAANKKNLTTFPGVRAAPCTEARVKLLMSCQLENTTCDESVSALAQFISTPDEE